MRADVVIGAEGLGKRYVIGHQVGRASYVALRDVIARNVRSLGRTAIDVLRGRPAIDGDHVEDFWALRDISFEVKRGEVLGVIGRNGAGKSTLLKILSRITEPTEGRVEIKGRIASLLEVGTGFHPELTGRANIYLNGSILGMTQAEIRRKFEEIVAFAEVDKFLDTPVKRYSSGMYVRLAFAVAAHLEPEILIVDEVLAVGDGEFQKKCLGKMGEVAGHGRTVLFVSHNMAAIRRLCSTAIVLKDGRSVFQGPVRDAVSLYCEGDSQGKDAAIGIIDLTERLHRVRSFIAISKLSFPDHVVANSYRVFEQFCVTFSIVGDAHLVEHITPWILFRNRSGEDVYMVMPEEPIRASPPSHGLQLQLSAPLNLAPGKYTVSCGILGLHKEILDWVDDAYSLNVEEFFMDGNAYDQRLGLTTAVGEWKTTSVP